MIRAGAHTDYGSVTLLFVQRDDAGGLQADLRYTKGTEAGTLSSGSSASQPIWTNVEPREGMIICNVADAIEFWTGGRYHSTIHRVALPRDEAQALTRYSMYVISLHRIPSLSPNLRQPSLEVATLNCEN